MPSSESLRAMMAMAAATASAAAPHPTHHHIATNPPPTRQSRQSNRPHSQNRHQSINQLIMESEPLPKGAPLPSPLDGQRWRKIAAVAAEIASKWVHPPQSNQYETDTLHHIRAILYLNKTLITQSFVSHISGVSQGSLSHYVRGLFRGNQQNIENRLTAFVRKFATGDLDTFLDEARSGSRPLRSVIYEGIPAPNAAPPERPAHPPPIPQPPQDIRPPVPPPPPPQLQPPPWSRPSPARPPLPAPMSATPLVQPSTLPHVVTPVQEPPAPLPRVLATERAHRTRQRQLSVIAKQRTKTRTPFMTWLEDTTQPTSTMAVEQAFHALVAPTWVGEQTNAEPLLVPIMLYVEKPEGVLHMYTQWDVNERYLSPELVADRIRRARGLGKEFIKPAAMQIRKALFEAGVLCAPPSDMKGVEERRVIRIEVPLEGGETLRDEFGWDLGMGLENSGELFAQYLCRDNGLPQKFAPVVAREIRKKLVHAQAIAYGDEELRRMAVQDLEADDPLRRSIAEVGTAHEEGGYEMSRESLEMEVMDLVVKPLLECVEKEVERKKAQREEDQRKEEMKAEVEKMRKQMDDILAERKRLLEEGLKEVDAAAVELQRERGLDFRPYLALKVGRGERPGVWTPGIFDRKRRRQTSFPMLQPSKSTRHLIQAGTRNGRRRRSTRREEGVEHVKRDGGRSKRRVIKKEDVDDETESLGDVEKKGEVHGKQVALRLRIREPEGGRERGRRSGTGISKRRRRR
eukprot:GFKZ01009285.1.p1 GENE.GFKZ01009285.1~~GFKZ01009285.1.p1  ORF type:complete len:779 (+),score=127.11 GFKZ01009285.1:106-2337(+)